MQLTTTKNSRSHVSAAIRRHFGENVLQELRADYLDATRRRNYQRAAAIKELIVKLYDVGVAHGTHSHD